MHEPRLFTSIGRILIVTGLALASAGFVLWLVERARLPQLPGDIVVERGRFTLVLPLATCAIVSVILTLLLRWLDRR